MQENNFEGQVHRIMEEFTVTPSEKVWGKVQADISGGKKSRFGMFPVAILIGCFLLTTFFLHDLEKKEGILTPSISTNKNNINEQGQVIASNDFSRESNTLLLQKNKTSTVNHGTGLNNVGINKTALVIMPTNNKINKLAQTTMTAEAGDLTDLETKNAVVHQEKKMKEVNVDTKSITTETKNDSIRQEGPLQKKVIPKETITTTEMKEAEKVNNATSKQENESQWNYFIVASAGGFSTGNKYLGQIANSAYYDYSSPLSSGSGAPNFSMGPSPVKPGFSFSIAAKANRKIAAKTFLSIGFGYQYAGTSVTTGPPVNGTMRESFSTGSSNSFNNTYHFIQLPVEVLSMIGNGNKLPLYWNAGFVYSRLVSVDALQYDNTVGRYYKDNSLFNKNNIGISVGLSLAILKKQKTQWLIGPQFYYGLTPVAGTGLYDNTHYSFLGIQLQKKL